MNLVFLVKKKQIIKNQLFFNKKNMPRTCTECDSRMNEGYCIDNGCEYYCSEKCLNKHYTKEEFLEQYNEWEWDSYWTEWEISDIEE